MKDLYFFIYHGSVLVVLGILPYILSSFNQKPLEILFVIGAVLGIELIVIGLSNLANRKISKIIRGVWGAFLGLIGLISIIQISFFLQSNGGLLNWQLLKYALTNTEHITPIISTEISFLWWLRFLIIIPIVYMFSHSGWQATRTNNSHRKSLSFVSLFIGAFLLSGQTGLATAYFISKSPNTDTTPSTIQEQSNVISLNNTLAAQASENKKYNVVIIILESVRASATSLNSTEFNTTPFLKAMADTGVSAEHSYVVQPHTSKSVTSILCGQPPDIHSSTIFGTKEAGLPYPCLPSMLKSIDYTTAFFQTATKNFEKRDALIKNMQFDHFIAGEDIPQKNWTKANYFGLEDKAMIEPAMNWVDEQDAPFLLTMLTLTSHHYYQVPPNFPKKQYADNGQWNDYLNTVKYTDNFLNDVWTEFKNRDLLDDTIFVFISDHGERFENNKTLGHHQSLDQDAIQIPFVVWNPTLIPNKKIALGPRQQIDVVPTVLDLLNIDTNNSSLPGLSLLDSTNNRPIYVNCMLSNCAARITGNQKFNYSGNSSYELYNVQKDPEGLNDLSTSTNFSTEQAKQYIKEIDSWKQYVKNLYY